MQMILNSNVALAALGALLGMAIALPVLAQDEIDRECIAECRESARDCGFDAREAGVECLEEAGCDVLRDAYREACFTQDRNDEDCAAARDELRSCLDPCREIVHEARIECREQLNECLSVECGIDDPRPLRRGHLHRARICHERCLEQGGEEEACRERCSRRPGRHRHR